MSFDTAYNGPLIWEFLKINNEWRRDRRRAVGVKAAHGAGLRCIAVATPHPPERLGSADWVVHSLSELSAQGKFDPAHLGAGAHRLLHYVA